MGRRLISLPFVTLAAWALTLGWLLVDQRYQLFLAPRFTFLVVAGSILAALLALGAAVRPPGRTRDHLIKGLFLLLPVLFIFASGDRTLGNYALLKRGMTPVREDPASASPGDQTQNLSQDRNQNGSQAQPPDDLPASAPPEPGPAPLVPISQLVRQWERYQGQRVSVEGLFSETVVDHDGLSAVFRYFITCCAADALPVGIFTQSHAGQGINSDDWVRATGTVRKTQLDGFEVIFMDQSLIEKQPKPDKNAAYIFD